MKTVTYYGKTFDVPNWVNFVIAEGDGTVWGYKYEPKQVYLEECGDTEYYNVNPGTLLDCIDGVIFPANDGKTYTVKGV